MIAAPREVRLGALHSALSFDRHIPALLEELDLPVVAINAENRPTDVGAITGTASRCWSCQASGTS